MERTRRATSPLTDLRALASQQHGVFGRAQAASLGVTRGQITHGVKAGEWERILPGIYIFRTAPRTWMARATAVSIWSRGVLCSWTAAALHDFGGRQDEIHVCVPNKLRSPALWVVPHKAEIRNGDQCFVGGLRVTTPTRTLVDLAGGMDELGLELMLDNLLTSGLVTLPRLRWCLQMSGTRGRPGTRLLRELVDIREHFGVPASVFQTKLFRLLRATDMPTPVNEYEIRDGGKVVARADLAYPDYTVRVEGHSYKWHGGRKAWAADLRKHNKVQDLDWETVYVLYDEVEETPDEVVARVRNTLIRRGWEPPTLF